MNTRRRRKELKCCATNIEDTKEAPAKAHRHLKMAFSLDSNSFFFEQVYDTSSGDWKARFTDLSWESLATFAFSTCSGLGRSGATPQIDEVVGPAQEMMDPRMVSIRSLFFEAYAMAAQSKFGLLDIPIPLPVGIIDHQDLEEAKQARRVTKNAKSLYADAESLETKTSAARRVYVDGNLTILIVDMNDIKPTLQHRGFCKRLGDILPHKPDNHKVQLFLDRASMDHVREADGRVYMERPDLTFGSFPPDDVLEHWKRTYDGHLLPQQPDESAIQQGEKRKFAEDNHLSEEILRPKPSSRPTPAVDKRTARSQHVRSTTATTEGVRRNVAFVARKHKASLPQGLRGMNNVANGEKLCYNFNLPKECKLQEQDRCERGLHLCMLPGCAQHHPLTQCPKRKLHVDDPLFAHPRSLTSREETHREDAPPISCRHMPMPEALVGMRTKMNGERLCYSYNLPQGCIWQEKTNCWRGLHRCMFPGCAKRHPLTSCPSKDTR